MNILIPHTWLSEYLETAATPEQLQQQLSLSGPSVERMNEIEGEAVFDIEVTTNRVDSMSIKGIAREAAVILNQFEIASTFTPPPLPQVPSPEGTILPLPVIVSDPKLTKRVMCVVLSGVEHTPTPPVMARRLRQVGQNVHDSMIDITNYITHELGHPCHAFDYDKIISLGGEIKIREATAGKSFVTLDDQTYTTVGGEIVFENQTGEIIDLPSIKGTLNTAVDNNTQNILFFIESLDPQKVRFASMTHAIRTVAAQLLEKNVDPELIPEVLSRGVQLYQELCHAQVASAVYDDYLLPRTISPITIPLEKISAYLGLELPIGQMQTILSDLGCQVEVSREALTVTPPSFRPDLSIAADVIEEIARVYGYHNLPSKLMDTTIPLTKPSDLNIKLENQIKHYLSARGWQEVYTYSLVSEALAQESGLEITEHHQLLNPLTDDRVYLRRSLVPSLSEVIHQNPQQPQLSVFELAHTYQPQSEELPTQELQLVMVSNLPFRQVKGELESLLRLFYISELQVITSPTAAKGWHQQGELKVKVRNTETKLGVIGTTSAGHTAMVIPIKELLSVAQTHPTYKSIPKTSPIIEDLTFTLQPKTQVGDLIAAVKKLSPLISQVTVSSIYQQNITFTINYWDTRQALTNTDVEPIRKKIASALQVEFAAQLVGEV